jgi:hypothetical protein
MAIQPREKEEEESGEIKKEGQPNEEFKEGRQGIKKIKEE